MAKDNKLVKNTVLEIPDEIKKKMSDLAQKAAHQNLMTLWNEYYSVALDEKISELLSLFPEGAEKPTPKLSVVPSPGAPAASQAPSEPVRSQALKEFDGLFMAIIKDFSRAIVSRASQSTEYVLELSGSFLNGNAHKALLDFYDLYFAKERTELDDTSEHINSEIDKMVNQIRSMLASGEEVNIDKFAEDEQQKRERLSLSALQKQLETIISLDAGIKKTLVPVLSGMQFEDLIKHRITNIASMWQVTTETADGEGNIDLERLGEQLAGLCSSQAERALYFQTVLKREAPEGISDRQSLVDIIF